MDLNLFVFDMVLKILLIGFMIVVTVGIPFIMIFYILCACVYYYDVLLSFVYYLLIYFKIYRLAFLIYQYSSWSMQLILRLETLDKGDFRLYQQMTQQPYHELVNIYQYHLRCLLSQHDYISVCHALSFLKDKDVYDMIRYELNNKDWLIKHLFKDYTIMAFLNQWHYEFNDIKPIIYDYYVKLMRT